MRWFSKIRVACQTEWSGNREAMYQRVVSSLTLVGLLVWLACVKLFGVYPPIGVYIAVLTFLAVVVALWPANTRWSKAAWMFSFLILMGLEIFNLYRDRQEQIQQQVRRDGEQREVLGAENRKFQSIAAAIGTSMENNKRNFTETTTRMEHLTGLAEQDINEITGGTDFVQVYPVTMMMSNAGMALTVSVEHCTVVKNMPPHCTQGSLIVRGVHIGIFEGEPPYVPSRQELEAMLSGHDPHDHWIGDVPPRIAETFLVVHPKITGVNTYRFNVMASNGSVSEALKVWFDPKLRQWQFGLRLWRDAKLLIDDHYPKSGFKGTS